METSVVLSRPRELVRPSREPVRVYSALDMPGRGRRAISRRFAPLGIGFGGPVHAKGSIATPLTIITSVTVVQWLRADLGITIATGVSSWADQASAGPYNVTQALGTAQPAYTATDATLNNQATLAGAGAQQLVNSAMPMGAGLWMSGIGKETTRSNAGLWGSPLGQTETCDLFDQGGTGALNLYSGVVVNPVALALNTWKRMEAFYSRTAAYLKVGSAVNAASADVGPNTCTGTSVLCTTGGAFWIGSIAERVVCSGKPTAPEIAALDAYFTARYGAGLV